MYHDVYDDEDRLTSISIPNVGTDTFTYNGLGLRVGKTDSTGTYSYLCDGASPGADVLYDGHAVYTAGLSETRNGVSSFYDFDQMGNLWTLDGSSKNQEYYQDTTGFGTNTATGGGTASPFKFGGGNGCLTDADTGLVLMGHRYYDTRIGRFITQDPVGDGDNWYAYCGNSPTNNIDPLGLETLTPAQLYGMMCSSGDYQGGDYSYNSEGDIKWTSADGTGHLIGSQVLQIPSSSGNGFSDPLGEYMKNPTVFGMLGTVRVYGDGVQSDFAGKTSPHLPESIPPGASRTQLIYDRNNTRIFRARTYSRLGVRLRDYDFAGRANDGPYPHGHNWVENKTGGSQQRSGEKININTGKSFNEEGSASEGMMQFSDGDDPMPFFDFFDVL